MIRRVTVTKVEASPQGRLVRVSDSHGTEFVFFWNDITTVGRSDGTRLTEHDLHVGHVIDVTWVERNAKRIPLSIMINE